MTKSNKDSQFNKNIHSTTPKNLNKPKQISADGENILNNNNSNNNSNESTTTNPEVFEKRRENAKKLAAGYTKEKRRMEIISITIFLSFLLYTFIFRCLPQFFAQDFGLNHLFTILFTSFLGILSADFISGLIHWMADTWGTVETPFVGQTFIRSFREHHVAPTAMCNHDIVETNGDNCLLSILFITPGLFVSSPSLQWYFVFFALYASLTNQIHKWSHTYKPSAWVAFLQDYHIILSRKHHAVHHRAPHDMYYCITTGWLNYPLSAIDFFKKFENLITFLSGNTIFPRSDDLKWVVIKPGGSKSH